MIRRGRLVPVRAYRRRSCRSRSLDVYAGVGSFPGADGTLRRTPLPAGGGASGARSRISEYAPSIRGDDGLGLDDERPLTVELVLDAEQRQWVVSAVMRVAIGSYASAGMRPTADVVCQAVITSAGS